MQYNAPHPSAAFEGYYSKFDLPFGAHLALILCRVPAAKRRPYMVSFTYVPVDITKIYQRELWAESMEMQSISQDHAFIIDAPGIGKIKWNADSTSEYAFACADFSFHATTTSRTPWSPSVSTPESLFVNLPLPLHWHVHSLASACTFSLKIPGYELLPGARYGQAIVHQEKNWAHSFPSAHMWLQARKANSSFCAAGGQILGMEAFLLGYRSPDLNFDFRPPFATRIAGVSPTMSCFIDWENRTFVLSIRSLSQKITVKANAPQGSFFSLSCPFPEGHRENFLSQSFQARFEVKVFELSWHGSWKLIREETFEGASLEFGGGYYPPAGSQERIH